MNSSTPAQDRPVAPQADGDPAVPAGMPLGARRLVLIGGLCIPVGLVAGPYLFGIQLIAIAGVVAVSVALAYGNGTSWFKRWSRLTAGAGAVWIATTIGYWLTIMAAADASAPVPEGPSALFYIGVVAFVVMAAAVLAGTVARFRFRRLQAGAAA